MWPLWSWMIYVSFAITHINSFSAFITTYISNLAAKLADMILNIAQQYYGTLLSKVCVYNLSHTELCFELLCIYISYQIFSCLADIVPLRTSECVVGLHDHPQHLHLFAVPKRRSTTQQGIHDDTTCPHIHLHAVAWDVIIHRNRQHFWSQIAWCSTKFCKMIIKNLEFIAIICNTCTR